MIFTREQIDNLVKKEVNKEVSLKNHMSDLNVFERFVISKKGSAFESNDFDFEFLKQYEDHLLSRVKKETAERHFSTLRKVSKILVQNKWIDDNYAAKIRPLQEEDRFGKANLSVEDLSFAMDVLRTKGRPFDTLVMSLCINLRASLMAISRIRNCDFDIETDPHVYIDGRKLPLVGPVLDDFKNYLETNIHRYFDLKVLPNTYQLTYMNQNIEIDSYIVDRIVNEGSTLKDQISLAVINYQEALYDISKADVESLISELFGLVPIKEDYLFISNGKKVDYNKLFRIVKKVSNMVDIKITTKEVQTSFDERLANIEHLSVAEDYLKAKRVPEDIVDLIYPSVILACQELSI